jgi:TetR/AcrR family transcriptional repressor of nem operon
MSETAQQIIDLAEEAIATKGYSAFSFREIAALMSIKSASVHYHFPTKAHLGLAVAARYRQRYAQALAQIEAEQPAPQDALTALVDIYRQQLGGGERMSVCMMLAAEIKLLPDDIKKEMEAFYGLNIDWFQRLVQRRQSDLPDAEARVLACQLFALLQGALLGAKTQGSVEYFEQVVAVLERLWLR